MFVIATDQQLGALKKIIIWHDNSGTSPNWYLRRVCVKDLQTDVSYHFLSDDWLSLDKADARIQKELFCCSKCNLHAIIIIIFKLIIKILNLKHVSS